MPHSDRSQDPYNRPDPTVEEAARRRDQGQRRVRKVTRWAVAATVAATALLGAGYAYAIPGSSAKPASTAPPAATPSGGVSSPAAPHHPSTTAPGSGGASPKPSKHAKSPKPATSSGGLRKPAQPPAPTTQPPQTTSGGS